MNVKPSRGEVWLADLNPIKGHEQKGRRPVLVVSDNFYNHGPGEMCIILPLTSTDRQNPAHIRVDFPEGGLKNTSFILCDQIRSITTERLIKSFGYVSQAIIDQVEEALRFLLRI